MNIAALLQNIKFGDRTRHQESALGFLQMENLVGHNYGLIKDMPQITSLWSDDMAPTGPIII